jgi:hypothetical protein
LNNGILFSMQTSAELMPLTGRHVQLLTEASGYIAVRDAAGRSIITGSKNILVFDHHCADLATHTG